MTDEHKEWWKKQYSDDELKSFGKQKLLEMMLTLPKDSEERNRVSRMYNILHVKDERGWDVTKVEETPIHSKSVESKIYGSVNDEKQSVPIYNVRRISCVYHGAGKGFDECLIASSEGDFNAKHIDVIGIKPKVVNKMGISPKGMVMETEAFNAYMAGNAIVDYDFRGSFERGNVGGIMMIRDLMSTIDKADLVKLHRFDWTPRKVSEKVKRMFKQ